MQFTEPRLSGLGEATKYRDSHETVEDQSTDSGAGLFNDVLNFVKANPLPTAFLTAAAGATAFGLVRLSLFDAAAVALKEAGSVSHLTTEAFADGIVASQKIGGRFGVFGLATQKVPENAFLRSASTLVTRQLSSEVRIESDAAAAFRSPLPVGPFSLTRNLLGVKSTPLGSIDLANNKFVPNEIFKNGAFRQASAAEKLMYKSHQAVLDFGIDSGLYLIGAAATIKVKPHQSPS